LDSKQHTVPIPTLPYIYTVGPPPLARPMQGRSGAELQIQAASSYNIDHNVPNQSMDDTGLVVHAAAKSKFQGYQYRKDGPRAKPIHSLGFYSSRPQTVAAEWSYLEQTGIILLPLNSRHDHRRPRPLPCKHARTLQNANVYDKSSNRAPTAPQTRSPLLYSRFLAARKTGRVLSRPGSRPISTTRKRTKSCKTQ